jgi:hypothetical protein
LFGSFERKERKKKRGVTLMIKEKASKRERLITKKICIWKSFKGFQKIQIHYSSL